MSNDSFRFIVERITTDKLPALLKSYADRGVEPFEIAYTGGRDWVVIYQVYDDCITVRSNFTPPTTGRTHAWEQ